MLELTLAALLVAAPTEDRRPTFVEFSAPAECPAAEVFVHALERRSDKVQRVEPDAATLFLTVGIKRARGLFRGKLSMRTRDGAAENRTLAGAKCETVVDALALAAALLIDPEGARLGPLPEEPLVTVAPQPEPEPPAAQVEPTPAVEVATPGEPVAAAAVAAAPAPAAPQPVEPVRSAVSLQFTLAAAGHATNALSSNLDFGGGLAVELAVDAGRIEVPLRLSGALGSGRTLRNAAGEMGYGVHGLFAFDAGARIDLGYVRPEVGASWMVLAMEVRSTGSIRNEASLRWLPVPAGYARVGLFVGGLRVAAQVAVGAHLLAERYLVDPDGEVFRVAPVCVTTQLQAGWAF